MWVPSCPESHSNSQALLGGWGLGWGGREGMGRREELLYLRFSFQALYHLMKRLVLCSLGCRQCSWPRYRDILLVVMLKQSRMGTGLNVLTTVCRTGGLGPSLKSQVLNPRSAFSCFVSQLP